ncbi:hypothetical protein TIFTF001_050615 [Ficus carica]|uniref:Uncharacterized protein n=1 Tax=Ficus carica TaxID=3494 RepID=A0AA87ZDF0_FICCA|nr:hypothetical protein TIFTF001_050615 [Ficus carica]
MLTCKVGVRGLFRLVQLASSWHRGKCCRRYRESRREVEHPNKQLLNEGDLEMTICAGKEHEWFSTVKDAVESYGVLERVSSTSHLLWVRNGERNATLVMVVVMVLCFRCASVMESSKLDRVSFPCHEWYMKCVACLFQRFSAIKDVAGSYSVLRGYPLLAEFSIVGVVAGSYGVLQRVSSTNHLLWVRNGERNATLVMVVVMVPYFRFLQPWFPSHSRNGVLQKAGELFHRPFKLHQRELS